MGIKENIDREKQSLMSTRRPYETAAFIIFSLLFLQQMFYLIRSLYLFAKNKTFFSLTNITSTGNLQAFFNRTVVIDSSKWIWVLLAVAFLVLYYFLIYIFVWRYCKKRNLAKWTWTTLVVFGPSLFFMPAYMFYIIYIFREYFFKFIKIVLEEYKSFDMNKMAEKEALILEKEEKEASERAKEREIKDQEKEVEKKKKEAEKDNKVEE
jgi:glucan phosphoethanolaminetransferase (alkaline phosphatase superfamily)